MRLILWLGGYRNAGTCFFAAHLNGGKRRHGDLAPCNFFFNFLLGAFLVIFCDFLFVLPQHFLAGRDDSIFSSPGWSMPLALGDFIVFPSYPNSRPSCANSSLQLRFAEAE